MHAAIVNDLLHAADMDLLAVMMIVVPHHEGGVHEATVESAHLDVARHLTITMEVEDMEDALHPATMVHHPLGGTRRTHMNEDHHHHQLEEEATETHMPEVILTVAPEVHHAMAMLVDILTTIDVTRLVPVAHCQPWPY